MTVTETTEPELPDVSPMTGGAAAPADSARDRLFETAHLRADLKGRAVRGGAWTLGAQFARRIIQLGSTTVLARLLTPADFGLMAMIAAVTGFVALFKDLGLSMATVQRDKITHEQVSTLFWINVVLSVAAMLVVAALAAPIAWFYAEPRLVWLTLGLAAGFLFGGLTVQHQALLRRQMRFGLLASIEVASTAVSVAVGIAAALAGAGVWALVLMILTGQAFRATLIWALLPWKPGLPRRARGIRQMLRFGGNFTGFNLVNYFARNLDNVLIGRVWGGAALGFYAKAYQIVLLPIRQVSAPIAAVAIPTLSRLQDDPDRLRRFYQKAISLIAIVTAPLMAFLAVTARELVILVLGHQWDSAVPIFRILAISALVQPIYNTQGWLHVAAGRTDRMLRWGLIGSTVLVSCFLLGLAYGPSGVALAYTIGIYVILGPCLWYAGRPVKITPIHIGYALLKPLVVTIATAGISWATMICALRYGAGPAYGLLLATLAASAGYVASTLLSYQGLGPFREIFQLLGTKKNHGPCDR